MLNEILKRRSGHGCSCTSLHCGSKSEAVRFVLVGDITVLLVFGLVSVRTC